jgi:hypothetical protein
MRQFPRDQAVLPPILSALTEHNLHAISRYSQPQSILLAGRIPPLEQRTIPTSTISLVWKIFCSVSSIQLSVDKHPGARHEQYENTALYATDSLLSLSNPYFFLVISLKAIGTRGRIASATFIGTTTLKTALYAPSRDLTGLTPPG